MGKLAGLIEAHYHEQSAIEIPVSEWQISIWVSPITLGQVALINEETDPILRCIKIIEVCAKDKGGARVFDQHDAAALRTYGVGKYGPRMITVLAEKIMTAAGADIDLDTAEGN